MRIVADLEKITANARATVDQCAKHGISVAAVTKCVCGEPEIVRAILAGGVREIGESRIDNVRRIRDAGIDCDILLLRLPALSQADDVVALTTSSLNSEPRALRALSTAAVRQGKTHEVLVIVEWGDRREGVMPEDAAALCRLADELPGLELTGLACSLNCLCGVLPTQGNMQDFADFVERLEGDLGLRLRTVSGGHTNNLQFVASGCTPRRIDHLRVGEGILFGRDSICDVSLPGTHHDTFRVCAEVIEVKEKPSAPDGETGPDAFMRIREWPDLGLRRRAILAMGEVDLSVQWITPTRPGVTIVGASSDHTVVDVTDADPPVQVGDELEFRADYVAVAVGWGSRNAHRAFVQEGVAPAT
jgi:predicted amino acid racemase